MYNDSNMATKEKKKGADKKSAKKSEEKPSMEEEKEEMGEEENTSFNRVATPVLEQSSEQSPEPVYEEPVLTLLIVERYGLRCDQK